jgi:ComF family protein
MKVIAWLLELLFPDRCAACGRGGGLLCARCRAGLRPYPAGEAVVGLDGAVVGWVFEGAVQRAVHALKYGRRRRVAGALADALADAVGTRPPGAALLPVPLHGERLAERGFNQSAELARGLGRRWGMPVVDGALARARDTGHQAGLSRRERLSNVAGAFVWRGAGPPPATVVLVDDVLTTGATLAACAAALREAGAREVRAVALAGALAPGKRGMPAGAAEPRGAPASPPARAARRNASC